MKVNYENTKKEIAKTRDNLKLKTHLFELEAQDMWKETEVKWHGFERNYAKLKHSTKLSSENIAVSLELLKDEINDGYKKIASSLKYGV